MMSPEVAVELVRRISAGESGAETELVERCGATLRFLARRFTRDEATAEDVFQETLIVALEKIRRGEVRQPERLAGFLRGLAKNLSVGIYRRAGATDLQPRAEGGEPGDTRPGPLGDLLYRETTVLTRRVISELGTDRDRQVLLRFYLAEEDRTRICDDLGLSADHFYRVLHRARERFRRLWEERVARA